MGLKNFVARMIGKKISQELSLEEAGEMDGTKRWFKSKTVWGGVYFVLRATYTAVQGVIAPQFGWTLPDVPPILDTIVGGIVGQEIIRGRLNATKLIGK